MRFKPLNTQINTKHLEKEMEAMLNKASKDAVFHNFLKAPPSELKRGLINQYMLSTFPDNEWPVWMKQQLNLENLMYNNPFIITNHSYTNSTILTSPTSQSYTEVSENGLVTPEKKWSFEWWVIHNGSLIQLSDCEHISQSFDDTQLTVTTHFEVTHNISISIEKKWSTIKDNDTLIVKTRITNPNKSPLKLIMGIRPYNNYGIAPIYSIKYKIHGELVINKEAQIVIKESPENVLCHSLKYADPIRKVDSWENIYSETCALGLGSCALVWNCEHHSETTLMYPINNQKSKRFRLNKIKDLNHYITQTDEKTMPSNVKSDNDRLTFETPDKLLNKVFKINLNLTLSIGTPSHPAIKTPEHQPSNDLLAFFFTRSLLKFGSQSNYESIKQYILTITKHTSTQLLCQKVVLIEECIQFRKQEFTEHEISEAIKIYKLFFKRIDKNSPSKLLELSVSSYKSEWAMKHLYHDQLIWIISALKTISQTKLNLSEQLRNGITRRLSTLSEATKKMWHNQTKKESDRDVIPTHSKQVTSKDLINNLIAIYPLTNTGFPTDLLSNTLQLLETKFVQSQLFHPNFNHMGVPIFYNFLLVHSYIQMKDPKGNILLNTLKKYMTQTGCWPQTINSMTRKGASGNGHDAVAGAEFLMVLRHYIVDDSNSNNLVITPYFPQEWANASGVLVLIKNLPVAYGTIIIIFGQ